MSFEVLELQYFQCCRTFASLGTYLFHQLKLQGMEYLLEIDASFST